MGVYLIGIHFMGSNPALLVTINTKVFYTGYSRVGRVKITTPLLRNCTGGEISEIQVGEVSHLAVVGKRPYKPP
jgi:hypothetical protein